MEVKDCSVPVLNGLYYMYKSFAPKDDQPPNKHLQKTAKGDAFVIKMNSEAYDGNGWAAYDDVPGELLDSRLLWLMIQAMV
jgi:hypothetical protein